ncbi:MAG: dUTP diphosphatase [Candidatus Aminicenantes bacterium]|nr:dUTP diphosphatase [Candidatus Aminicenantes bacterium]
MTLRVRKLNPLAKLPQYSHSGDAGLDLFASEEILLKPGEIKAIGTGLQMAIPPGYVGLIWDKSGLSLRGLHRLAGVIDSSYRGEVRVVLVNLAQEDLIVQPGMKIAQLLIQPIEIVEIEEVKELESTSRGEKGFGSTGQF